MNYLLFIKFEDRGWVFYSSYENFVNADDAGHAMLSFSGVIDYATRSVDECLGSRITA